MIDINKELIDKLYYKEIEGSDSLLCPGAVSKPSHIISQEELDLMLKEKSLTFPKSLVDFYSQAAMLSLTWIIVDERFRNGKEREALFKEDPWIKKEYLT